MEHSAFSTFKRLVSIFPGKWILVVSVTATAIIAALNIVGSHTLRGLLDAAIMYDLSGLRHWLYLALVSSGIAAVLRYFRNRLDGRYAEQGLAKLRAEVAVHLSQVQMSEMTGKHSGDYVSRLTNDLNRLQGFYSETLINVFFQPLAAIMAFAYLMYLNWKLTVVTLVGVPLIFIAGSLLSKSLQKYSREHQESLGVMNSQAQDAIAGIEVARAFGLKEQLHAKYQAALDTSVNTRVNMVVSEAILEAVSTVLSLSPYFILFGLGGVWVIRGDLTPGSLIAFLNLLNHLTWPMGQLSQLVGTVRRDMASAQRVLDMLDLPTEMSTGEVAKPEIGPIAIEFRSVDFSYTGHNEKVLNGLSFAVKRGETVALVGASGSGKSTVLKLLQRFYQPVAGGIEVFGLDIAFWNLAELRDRMALVNQDAYLFPGTIQDNIGYGREAASQEEIVAAARAAHAHDFISQFPDQYETKVGELGSKLSGGQRQRITLARAILKNAPILLLDEATSALDVQSEYLVQQAIEHLMAGRTALVVAHRLSTIRHADRILVMDRGSIVEEGTHAELLEYGGVYADLYRHQLASEVTEKEAV